MKKIKFILLTASILFAMAFTFSCSGDEGNGNEPSSSSIVDNSANWVYDVPVEYGGKTYKTVKIGKQIWMAENLNYAVEGSKCYGEDGEIQRNENGNIIFKTLSPDEVQANCATYGRLYNWSTAMGLPSGCNMSPCASLIKFPNRGICPSGWHIPSDAEWTILTDYVGNKFGTKLKATSGWNDGGNGTDEYGFSALPGGIGIILGLLGDPGFFGLYNDVGYVGYWWGASNASNTFGTNFHGRSIYSDENTSGSAGGDGLWKSVRCIADESVAPSSSSSSSSSITYESKGNNISSYKTVKIGNQTWMAENLDYAVEGSKCWGEGYGEDGILYVDRPPLTPAEIQANCDKYGRLYSWATAMELDINCDYNSCENQIQAQHRGICPSGWHIPNGYEWNALINYVGGFSTAGIKLKAASGWYNNGNGTDEYGFSALPGGYGESTSYSSDYFTGGFYIFYGPFVAVGEQAYWWSTDYSSLRMASDGGMYDAIWSGLGRGSLQSVRCVQDLVSGGKGNSISNYRTVKIGDQTWMAENLDYAVEGSKCYDNDLFKCNTYGRLYDRSTAMGFPSSCNSSDCSDLIQSPHQGICPDGWHIPSDNDWDILMNYAGCDEAGKKLKAKSGWASTDEYGGTDEYGFSALPGGHGGSDGNFYEGNSNGAWGYIGSWWSSEEGGINGDYGLCMNYLSDGSGHCHHGKGNLFSVRCLQNGNEKSSSCTNPVVSNGSVTCGGQTYKTVVIGTQTWFAENLNYNASSNKCYDYNSGGDSQSYYDTYGRLYDWATAMGLVSSCTKNTCSSKIQAKHQGICPSGWHIPSNAEWTILTDYVGSNSGTKLKAASGWNDGSNGTDEYGFSALPGGHGGSDGSFYSVGNDGIWWSASENDSNDAYQQLMGCYYSSCGIVDWDYGGDKSYFYSLRYSVRCVQD